MFPGSTSASSPSCGCCRPSAPLSTWSEPTTPSLMHGKEEQSLLKTTLRGQLWATSRFQKRNTKSVATTILRSTYARISSTDKSRCRLFKRVLSSSTATLINGSGHSEIKFTFLNLKLLKHVISFGLYFHDISSSL